MESTSNLKTALVTMAFLLIAAGASSGIIFGYKYIKIQNGYTLQNRYSSYMDKHSVAAAEAEAIQYLAFSISGLVSAATFGTLLLALADILQKVNALSAAAAAATETTKNSAEEDIPDVEAKVYPHAPWLNNPGPKS